MTEIPGFKVKTCFFGQTRFLAKIIFWKK